MILFLPKTAAAGVFRVLALLLSILTAGMPALSQTVSGNIHRNSGSPVPGVTVNMTGSATGSMVTGAPGNYQFSGLAAGSNLTITPSKDLDPTECVSVRDMILIGKHILGIAPLPTPYAMIAADVNKSSSITSFDIQELRKLILGIYTQFPAQTSWTFVPSSFAFPNPSNPFATAIPASATIPNLQGNAVEDFIGIKTGDVTDCVGDAPAPAFLTLSAGNVAGTLGQQVIVPVTAQGFSNVSGLQFSMQWDPALLHLDQVTNLNLPGLSSVSFNPDPATGKLAVCWSMPNFSGQTVPDGTAIFELQFTVTGTPTGLVPVGFGNTPTRQETVDGNCLPFALHTAAGGVQTGAGGAGCCASQQAFDALVAQGFTSVHQQCGVSVQPNGLDAGCHRVTYNWGDGNTSGPLAGTVAAGHLYDASGFYTVCAHVEAIGANGQACFSRDTCWGICVVCDSCSNPAIRNDWAVAPAASQNFSGSNAMFHVYSDPLNGDFYATGHFQGTYTLGGDTKTSAGGQDVFVAKYHNNGVPESGFLFAFGGAGDDQGSILRPAPGGGFYLGGLFASDSITLPSPGPGGYPARTFKNAGVAPHPDAFLARYDANRNLLWALRLGDNWAEQLNGMAVDPAGNVYIAGQSLSKVDFNPLGAAHILNIPVYAPFAAKYDPNGQLVWVRTMYDTSQQRGGINLGLALDASANVYVCGEFYGRPALDGWPVPGGGFPATGLFSAIPSGITTGTPYVAKFNSQGDLQWAFDIQNNLDKAQGAVWDVETHANRLYLAGAVDKTNPLNFDPRGGNASMQNVLLSNGNFLACYDLDGHGQKVVAFGPNRGVFEIETGPNGDVFAAGLYGNSLMLASIFDDTCALKKELITGSGGGSNDLGWSIAPDPFGGFAMAGLFKSPQFDADPAAGDGPEFTFNDGLTHYFLGKYSCVCPPGAANPCNTLCDSIHAVITGDPSQSGCCHHLQIDNQKPGAFAYVNLCVLSGGELKIPVGIEAGWSVQGYSSSNIYFVPDAGSIGVGLNNVAYFCLQNLSASTQVVEVKYYDAQQQVVCRDTLTLHCTPCVQAIVDSVYCNGWGHYQFDVCIKAGETLGYAANSVTLVPLGGVTFDNSVFPLPNLAPGDTFCHLTVAVGNVAAGQQACFYAIIHDLNVAAGEPDTYCCADTVPVCFTLPDCDPCTDTYASAQQLGDSCCWKITLHNPPAFFTGLGTEIITSGVEFSSIGNYAGSGWMINTAAPFSQDHVWWKPVSPQGAFIQNAYMLPTVCLGSDGSGLGSAAQEIAFSWLGQDSTWCFDTLALECPISDNPGAGCLQIQTTGLNCTSAGVYQWNFNLTNLTDPGIQANLLELSGVLPSGSVVPTNFYGTFSPGSTTALSAVLHGNSGDRICFHVTLHQANHDSLHLNCCSLPDTMCLVLPNCFPSIGPSFTVLLFPNPASEVLHLAFSAPLPAPATVQLLDITGRPVRGRTELPAGLEQTVLHLGQLTDGVYLADIQVTGLVAVRKRFIVQRGGVEWEE